MQHRRSPNLSVLFLYDVVLSDCIIICLRSQIMKLLNYIAVKLTAKYYKNILYSIKEDEHASDYIYDPRLVLMDQEHDTHIHHFEDNIDISIQYSIPIIKKLANKENERYIPFRELKKC